MANIHQRSNTNYFYEVVDDSEKELGIGVRHVQAILLFFCTLLAYSIRVSMSIGIVAMTTKSSESDDIPYFLEWDKHIESLILSSFFIGYLLLQIPGGILSVKIGGKRLIAAAMIINGILCLLLPTAVKLGGWKALVAVRIGQGVTQGVIYPSLNTLIGKWAPLNERCRLSSYIFAGGLLGPVVTLPICGLLAASFLGWPSIFYTFGVAATLFGCTWAYYGADSPSVHKSISEKEKTYIENSLGIYENNNEIRKKVITPWFSMFTSVHEIALCFAHAGATYISLFLLLETPTYLEEVHQINIKQNGFLTAIPYLTAWLMSIVCGQLADFLVNKYIMSTTDVRKLCNTIANLCPSVFLIILCILPANQSVLSIVLITVIIGCTGANCTGVMMNPVDLSPNFAGILMGFNNTVGNILGVFAPTIVGFVIKNSNGWNTVFFITAGICTFTSFVYLAFGSAEKQPWDDLVYSEDSSKNKN